MARNKYDIDESLETPFNFEHLKRSMIYIKKHRFKMLLALTLSALSVIFSLIIPLLIKRAMDVSIKKGMNGDISELLLIGGAMAVAICLSVICSNARGRIMTRVGQDIIYDIRKDLFAHLQKLPFSYYDDRPHGKILVRVISYVNAVSDMLSNGIINFILEIFNIIFICIFMFITNVQLSLVILAGIPLFVTVILLIKRPQRRSWQSASNKGSNINAYLNESINGMKVTQIFTREKTNHGIFARLVEEHRKIWIKAVVISNMVWASTEIISTLVFCSVYLVGVLVITPAVSFGTLLAMSNYASRFWQPVSALANIYNNFMNTIAYLERIFQTMDEPVLVDDCEGAYTLPEIKGEVEFKDVTFGYVPDVTVLEKVNFRIEPGENVALVGPTGAGKTTIVNLISRFYNLSSGQILVDGHDISKVTLHSLRSQMGIMLQDSFIFSGTIEENIRYGKLDAAYDEILAASKAVKADEFIQTMPKKYDTEVNERGARLSQGQKQLVSFARTLVSDPKILILDEATSSIDTKTERLMQEGLRTLLAGRTSFIIAHRLSTIKSCDKIMYIADKGIIEWGTHDQLMEKKGEYYKLYTAQQQEQE